jgi:two-component system, NtrC family, sensor histidine kinase HydH
MRLSDFPRPGVRALLGGVLGIVLAAVDTAIAVALGIRFEINGRDASPLVFAYFSVSFFTLGGGLGLVLDARKREGAQRAELAAIESRLRASERLAALGQLAGGIAHEVRNPLAIIRSSVQNVKEGLASGDASGKEGCDFAIGEIDRLTRVTTALLGFVRPLGLRRGPTPIEALFGRAELLSQAAFSERDASLVRGSLAPSLVADVDADLLTQVLLSLLTNALEASPKGTAIELTASSEGDRVLLSVADRGSGISDADAPRIFDPLHTTKPSGNGLGLAIARQIVEAHGGQIRYRPREGGGSELIVSVAKVEAP